MKRNLSLLTMATSVALVLALGVGIAHAQEVIIALNPSPGQTASGTAELTAISPTTTRVDVTVSGLTPSTSISNHIHGGSCVSVGGFQFALSNLNTDAQGNASATTMLNVSLSSLAGMIIIAPHVEAGGAPTICGAIPAVAAAPAATPTTAAPTPVVAGVTALPAAGGLPVPFVPTALLSALAMGIGIYLRRR